MLISERIRGFYRGLIPNLVGIIPEKAIKLAVNDYCREKWGDRLQMDADRIPVVYGMLSGATAGFCQVIATNPMEIVKIQLQLAGTRNESKSAMDVVRELGPKGLYRGTLATLARDVPFSIIFFSLQATIKNWMTPANKKSPLSAVFFSGIFSGAIAAAAVTPMDVVKTRLQVIKRQGDTQYRGQLDCYRYFTFTRTVLAKDGISGLFKGVVPRVLIVSPLFAITVLVYEFQQRIMNK
jgi:hypothetical protein